MRYFAVCLFFLSSTLVHAGSLVRTVKATSIASTTTLVVDGVPSTELKPTALPVDVTPVPLPGVCTDRDALEACGFQMANGHDCLNSFPDPTTAPDWCNPLPSNTGGSTCFCAYQQPPDSGWINASGDGIATEDRGLSFE